MEFWAIIDGFEDYQVSTEGRVRRCRRAAYWHQGAIDRRTTTLLGFNYAE